MIYTTISLGLTFGCGLRLVEFEVSGCLPTHGAWSVTRGLLRGVDAERWLDDVISAARPRAAAKLGCGEDGILLTMVDGVAIGEDTDDPELSIDFLRVDDLRD